MYGESNGIIWDIVVNKTSQPFNKLFVVGAFDTVSETSQIQFCSVGEWDGLSFDKVRTLWMKYFYTFSSTLCSVQSVVVSGTLTLF